MGPLLPSKGCALAGLEQATCLESGPKKAPWSSCWRSWTPARRVAGTRGHGVDASGDVLGSKPLVSLVPFYYARAPWRIRSQKGLWLLTRDELTDPERKLWDGIVSGVLIDLRSGDPERDDPAAGETWDISRQLRAQLLFELLTRKDGSTDPRPRSLRLAGARITGVLDLEASTLACPVLLRGCYFDESIALIEASTYALRLPGCHVPGLLAAQLRTQGNLELNDGFTSHDEIDLVGAHIGGQLNFNGATITNPDGIALRADGLTVDQALLFGSGFRARGEINLNGAHVGGQLNFNGAALTNTDGVALDATDLTVDQLMLCGSGFHAEGNVNLGGTHVGGQLSFVGATLTNPNGVALHADSLTIDEHMLCHGGFRAEGEVNLIGAHVGGQLNFNGATLTNPNGMALCADGLTVDQAMLCSTGFRAEGEVNLRGARVIGQLNFDGAVLTNPDGHALYLQDLHARAFLLRPKTPPEGEVDLTNAQVGFFLDEEATWPTSLAVRGFIYDALYERTPISVTARLRWLDRDPAGYAPQPYEQLVAVYRRAGRDEDARKVAIARQRARRGVLKLPGKVWNSLLRWTVGYGYRTWQAGGWLLRLLVVGAAIFAWAYPGDMALAKKQGDPLPAFQPWVYSLDVLLPVVNLHQEEFWIPQGVARWWAWFSILAGWLLTTMVIAALTGLLKKD